jgi:site-specific DNA-methyltransferase (adenine-specific)
MANDENDGPRLQAFLESAFQAAIPHLRADAAWYLWHAQMAQGFFAAAAAAAAAAQVKVHRQIIWVKPSLILGHGDYHWRHELCFYGWREGNRCRWFGDRCQTTVWELGRENDGMHPTQKPVELFAWPMQFNTEPGDLCYEPFSGSGTQLCAAEPPYLPFRPDGAVLPCWPALVWPEVADITQLQTCSRFEAYSSPPEQVPCVDSRNSV